MAAITDLTFEQLNTALGNNAITLSAGKVLIDASLVTGETIDALTDFQVLKFVHKFLNACATAQTTVNTGQATGERLQAFGNASYGSISNGLAPVTRQVVTRVNVNTSSEITGQIG